MRWLLRLDDVLACAEKILVALLLSAMILVAFSQIVLRNFFGTGLSWSDSLVRYLVLWVAFIGAALATRENRHIQIELFSRWTGAGGRRVLTTVSHAVSIVVCGLLMVAAIRFIQFEAQMGGSIFLGLPVWFPGSIIPVAFSVITFRYVLRLITAIFPSVHPSQSPAEY
jgi:TRAP-type C4-dicarboxylate transport system permease small subunit